MIFQPLVYGYRTICFRCVHWFRWVVDAGIRYRSHVIEYRIGSRDDVGTVTVRKTCPRITPTCSTCLSRPLLRFISIYHGRMCPRCRYFGELCVRNEYMPRRIRRAVAKMSHFGYLSIRVQP